MLITKAEAARILGISEPAIQKWKDKSFFVHSGTKVMIDTDNPDWINELNKPRHHSKNKAISDGAIKHDRIKKAFDTPEEDDFSSIRDKEGGRFFNGALRQAILKRDHFRCVQCGKTPADGIMLEVDHIIEFEDGGKTTFDNGQTLCKDCNKGKHSLKVLDDNGGFISQNEFAKRVGIHRNTLTNLLDKGIIEKDQTTGLICYETEFEKYKIYSRGYIPPEQSEDFQELTRQAAIAEMQETIFTAKIKEEKSKQEEIKTLELKRDLAPMYLVKHFFSFAENMIQRAYRRYNELSPELEALYLAGKREQAVKFLLREQESITKDAVDKLIKAIKEEGYSI